MVLLPDEFQITSLGGGVRNSFPFCILFDSIQSSSATDNLSYIKTARQGYNNIMSGILKEKGFFGNLSKKEYMRGNREYIRQVQIYWSKHKMLFPNEEEIIAKIEEDDSKDDE